MAERLVITQDLCRKVQVMLKGTTVKETARLLGIGESTVGRIKQAGFDVEQYRKIIDARKEKEQPAEEEQIPGQIALNLFPQDPDERFDENVKAVLEAMQKNSETFREGMEEINNMKADLNTALADLKEAQKTCGAIMNMAADVAREILERTRRK